MGVVWSRIVLVWLYGVPLRMCSIVHCSVLVSYRIVRSSGVYYHHWQRKERGFTLRSFLSPILTQGKLITGQSKAWLGGFGEIVSNAAVNRMLYCDVISGNGCHVEVGGPAISSTSNSINTAYQSYAKAGNRIVATVYELPYILYSDDDGNTWKSSPSIPIATNTHKAVISIDDEFYMFARNTANVYRSSDGISWSLWFTPKVADRINFIMKYLDKIVMFGYGYEGTSVYNSCVYVSSNGGVDWTRTVSPTKTAITSAAVFNDEIYVTTGNYDNYKLYKSTDGISFTEVSKPSLDGLQVCATQESLFIYSTAGIYRKSVDTNFVSVPFPSYPANTAAGTARGPSTLTFTKNGYFGIASSESGTGYYGGVYFSKDLLTWSRVGLLSPYTDTFSQLWMYTDYEKNYIMAFKRTKDTTPYEYSGIKYVLDEILQLKDNDKTYGSIVLKSGFAPIVTKGNGASTRTFKLDGLTTNLRITVVDETYGLLSFIVDATKSNQALTGTVWYGSASGNMRINVSLVGTYMTITDTQTTYSIQFNRAGSTIIIESL